MIQGAQCFSTFWLTITTLTTVIPQARNGIPCSKWITVLALLGFKAQPTLGSTSLWGSNVTNALGSQLPTSWLELILQWMPALWMATQLGTYLCPHWGTATLKQLKAAVALLLRRM